MKLYLWATTILFGLITLAHLFRMHAEPDVATDAWYILITAVAVALCGWGCRLLYLTRTRR
jgi:hypothetical protein